MIVTLEISVDVFGETGCVFLSWEIPTFGGVRLLRGDWVFWGNGGLDGEITFFTGDFFCY